jgi:hypothetical protein
VRDILIIISSIHPPVSPLHAHMQGGCICQSPGDCQCICELAYQREWVRVHLVGMFEGC